MNGSEWSNGEKKGNVLLGGKNSKCQVAINKSSFLEPRAIHFGRAVVPHSVSLSSATSLNSLKIVTNIN